MLQSFLILFRETLEAALVVGIVLGYLARTGQSKHRRWVYLGIAAGAAASLAGALLFQRLAGGFSGRAEEIFEGMTMLAAAALLTSLIFWMMNKRSAAARLEQRVAQELSRPKKIGLFLLVFASIVREGIESVFFLGASGNNAQNSLPAALAGMAAAALLGAALFRGAIRIRLRSFFTVTNVLLILFAAGLLARGVHELQEAGVLAAEAAPVWDINPPVDAEDGYPPLHEEGAVGGLAKGLFGYNGDPSRLELAAWLAYLAAAAVLWVRLSRKRSAPA
jgi:high-affinity iron transporter